MTGKKKLFLHIGRHKTGTTSLQKFLTQNTDMLSDRGILYPQTGRQTRKGTLDTAHHDFSSVLRFKKSGEIESLFKQLEKESKDYDAILLSSEDFQNQKDFARLAEVFEPYDLTVICYLREGLSYGLSGFAQRIHFSSEIFNIRQYMERQNIRLSGFIRQWERLADESIFRLYERDKLKNRDIVEDFLDILSLDDVEDTSVVLESNPSLSGNLLGLKMLLNLIGQGMLAPYSAFESAARLAPKFQGKIHISDRVAEELRGLDDYNAVLKSMFPDMSEPSFEGGSKVFDLSTWDSDMDLISTVPEFAFAKTIRLEGLGRLLSGHGVYADLGESDFLTPEMIDAIQLPETAQNQQILERAMNSANEAMVARKGRANAESAAVIAKTEAFKAQQTQKSLALDIRKLTKKFRIDNKAVAKQLASAIKERDEARTELQSRAQLAQAESKKSLELFQKRIEESLKKREGLAKSLDVVREDRGVLQEKIKTLTAERTNAVKTRDELIKKQQAEIADKNQQLETQRQNFNETEKNLVTAMAELREERAQTLAARDEVIKKQQAELAEKAEQIGSEIETRKASELTLNTAIAELREERAQTLAARDEVIKKQQIELGDKNQQLETQRQTFNETEKNLVTAMAELREERAQTLAARDEVIKKQQAELAEKAEQIGSEIETRKASELTFNTAIAELREERAQTLAARDEVIKKQQAELADKNQKIETQLKRLKDVEKQHHSAMAELRADRERALLTRDELIESLRTERDKRGKILKQRDAEIKKLKAAILNGEGNIS